MVEFLLETLRNWAKKLKIDIETEGVYAFGSLIYRNGVQFNSNSDIDLLVRFPNGVHSALERLRWTERLLSQKKTLETQLALALGRSDSTAIASLVVATRDDIQGGIHKDRMPAFFSGSQFLNLLTDERTAGVPGAGTKPVEDVLALSCLQFAQKTRNQYLDVSGGGGTTFSAFDGSDPLPKEIMRHAAMAAGLTLRGKELGSQFDVQLGLDFVSSGLFKIRSTDAYIEELHDRLSARRNARGKGGPIEPRDKLFLAEWLVDQTLDALKRRRSNLFVAEPVIDKVRDVLMTNLAEDLKERGWRIDYMDKGQGATHPKFNFEITTRSPIISLNCSYMRWTALDYYSDDLLAFALGEARRKGSEVFNDKKIRVASELIESNEVTIEETDYFSSMMTDQFAWVCVRSKQLSEGGFSPKEVLWDGVSAFIDNSSSGFARLKGLSETYVSNQLGVSTLAFTSDGHLMVVYQSDQNNQSKQLLAPSGSGSLDWADVAAVASSDMLSLVRYGGNREMQEECALDSDSGKRKPISSGVMVTAFTRMLHRAGKPEFFCLGCIGAPAKELIARKPERYVDRILHVEIDRANWANERPSSEIARVCNSYLNSELAYQGHRIPLSYPLEHGLKLLIELCHDGVAARSIDAFVRKCHAGDF